MSSSPRAGPRRKPAQVRRAEIVSAASTIALDDGLNSLTLRRVAATLGVVPGLVHHYFPSVDDLVAAAFAQAATEELEEVFTAIRGCVTPLARLRLLINLLVSEDRDQISLLWLDAWQGGRHRPTLREEVIQQMLAWQHRLARLIAEGVEAGALNVQDPNVAAMRILAIIDGLSVQAAVRASIDYATVRAMVMTTTEHELGLPRAALHSDC